MVLLVRFFSFPLKSNQQSNQQPSNLLISSNLLKSVSAEVLSHSK